uniref:Adenylate kinase isoenzyme 6-like n=1 Tax=Dermatophagoides pteronyssinus TaxID=6956 RepID=A0A6P6XLV3_DERPT|nr:adenylate kinase isoenzyme 6-like [Dermatophagoides pteronyssinus]
MKFWRILVTGLPGTGKTTLCKHLKLRKNFFYLNVAELIKNEQIYNDFDTTRDCTIYDGERLYQRLDNLITNELKEKRVVVDFHTLEDFALKRWFNLIIILHASSPLLEERYIARNYSSEKIIDNLALNQSQYILDVVYGYFDDTNQSYVKLPDDLTKAKEYAFSFDTTYILERFSETSEQMNKLLQDILIFLDNLV